MCAMEFVKVQDWFGFYWGSHQTTLVAFPGGLVPRTALEAGFHLIAWQVKVSPELMHACGWNIPPGGVRLSTYLDNILF